MPQADQPAEAKAEHLAQLAAMQGITIAPAEIQAMARQLQTLRELERAELQDTAPALKMEAAWHD